MNIKKIICLGTAATINTLVILAWRFTLLTICPEEMTIWFFIGSSGIIILFLNMVLFLPLFFYYMKPDHEPKYEVVRPKIIDQILS